MEAGFEGDGEGILLQATVEAQCAGNCNGYSLGTQMRMSARQHGGITRTVEEGS